MKFTAKKRLKSPTCRKIDTGNVLSAFVQGDTAAGIGIRLYYLCKPSFDHLFVGKSKGIIAKTSAHP